MPRLVPSAPTLSQGVRVAWPDFLIAANFVIIWIDPNILRKVAGWLPGPGLVGLLVFVFVFEFIFISFYGPVAMLAYSRKPAATKAIGLSLIGVIFIPILATFCRAAKGIWPLVEFLLLGWNKWHSGRASAGYQTGFHHIIFRWAAMGGLYLAAVFFATIVPVPTLGVERWMSRESGIPMSGDFVSKPHQFLAAGAIYFTCLGIFEIMFDRVARKV